jgi:coenzyme F420-0:L-glutamate ligase/coenzyme F420-1:gamma-L-glutamate ligase
MQFFGISTELIHPKSDLVSMILEAIDKQGLRIDDNDVLAIASKAVATAQNRLKRLGSVAISDKAKKLSRRYALEPNFVAIVLQEAEKVYGGVPKALLTLKDDILTANAGVDQKNAPKGYVILWPKNAYETAEKIRKEIFRKTRRRVGIIIVDSRVTPLRMGTTGIALGAAGFEPVRDYRTEEDLYGKSILITRHALADDLASASHLIMGESNEQVSAVLVRNAPVRLTEKPNPFTMVIPWEQCLFASHLEPKPIT